MTCFAWNYLNVCDVVVFGFIPYFSFYYNSFCYNIAETSVFFSYILSSLLPRFCQYKFSIHIDMHAILLLLILLILFSWLSDECVFNNTHHTIDCKIYELPTLNSATLSLSVTARSILAIYLFSLRWRFGVATTHSISFMHTQYLLRRRSVCYFCCCFYINLRFVIFSCDWL